MSIRVEHEDEDQLRKDWGARIATIIEECCFCETPTRYWTKIARRKPEEQVPCCQDCAKTHLVRDVPAKWEVFHGN